MSGKTKLVPPDGGWGILVCIGMAMMFISTLAVLPSFGLIFGDFLRSIGAETSDVTLVTGIFFSAYSFAGLFSSSLYKCFSLRTVALIGGIIYFLGSLGQIFVTSVLGLIFAFSIMQGVAFGLMAPTSYAVFNNYFVKRRIMWMSFAQSLVGIGTMLYPILMQILLEAYGFRGCLLVLAAINAHSVLGMLLMHPVEWHMRRVPLTDEELAELNADVVPAQEQLTPLMPAERKRSSLELSNEELRSRTHRASSIASLGNWTGPVAVPEATQSRRTSVTSSVKSQVRPVKSTWQRIVDFLDLTLLKKPIYVNCVLGISFALFSDIAFFTLQPLYLFELKFSKADTASIIAIGAAADLVSRIVLAFGAVFVTTPSRYIYLAGSFFTVIARFAFLHVFDFTGMAIITAVLGFLRTWVHVPLPLVFAEYLPKERFAKGYGLFMFLQGNIMFAVGPFVGLLRDLTQDYVLTFHCLNLFMALCAFPWLIEIIIVKYRRRHKNGANKQQQAAATVALNN